MSERDDGGAAFPVIAENGLGHISGGMTLRDWFAGQAIAGIFAERPVSEFAYSNTAADAAYVLADALLARRKHVEGE